MPKYLLTLSCGHALERQSETVPASKNPSCSQCPPDEKYGKPQRPVVTVEVEDLDSSTGWTRVERPDLPTTPRGARLPSVPTAQLVEAVKDAILYVSEARWATGEPLRATPALDAVATLWAGYFPLVEAPPVEAPTVTVEPVDLTSGVRTVGDLTSKLAERLAEVEKNHAEADSMSRRECLAYLSGRGYTGVSRKPVGELREMVLAEKGIAV